MGNPNYFIIISAGLENKREYSSSQFWESWALPG